MFWFTLGAIGCFVYVGWGDYGCEVWLGLWVLWFCCGVLDFGGLFSCAAAFVVAFSGLVLFRFVVGSGLLL